MLTDAQRKLTRFKVRKMKERKTTLDKMQKVFEVAGRVWDAKSKYIDKAQNRASKPISEYRALELQSEAWEQYMEARYMFLGAALLAVEIDVEIAKAEAHVKDLKVHRLKCQLRVARRSRRKRRGWSTTRVRFHI